MKKENAPDNIDNEYSSFRYEGFNWRYRKILTRNGQVDFELFGPLCVKKSCYGDMSNQAGGVYKCINCDYENQVTYDFSALVQKTKSRLKGEWTKGLKFTNLDKLPSINETLEEENK